MSTSAANRRAPRKRRKSARASSGQGLTPWLVLLAVVAGGIATYDNRVTIMKEVSPYLVDRPSERQASGAGNARAEKPEKKSASVARRDPEPARSSGSPVPPVAVGQVAKLPVPDAKPTDLAANLPLAGQNFTGKFYYCGTSGLDNCIESGDTFWYRKTKVVLSDIVAPGTEDAACRQERDRGFAAKVRLRDLLNDGKFDLEILKVQGGQDRGPVSRVVTRNGRSLGSILVSEGLAQPRMGRRQSWCP